MSRLDRFEELVRRARGEPAPTPDVTAAVVRRLLAFEAPAPTAVPLLVAAACAAAAVVMGYLGLQAWAALVDPSLGPALSLTGWWLL